MSTIDAMIEVDGFPVVVTIFLCSEKVQFWLDSFSFVLHDLYRT